MLMRNIILLFLIMLLFLIVVMSHVSGYENPIIYHIMSKWPSATHQALVHKSKHKKLAYAAVLTFQA